MRRKPINKPDRAGLPREGARFVNADGQRLPHWSVDETLNAIEEYACCKVRGRVLRAFEHTAVRKSSFINWPLYWSCIGMGFGSIPSSTISLAVGGVDDTQVDQKEHS
jgi:hypothetical protein